MLEGLHLKNFKSARDLEVPLAPLTLFAGLNGSGKSSVLQSLGLLRQSYAAGVIEGVHLGGPLVSLGLGGDVLSEGAKDDEQTISLSIVESGKKHNWSFQYRKDASFLNRTDAPTEYSGFATHKFFQYLQADRLVPRTLYPRAREDTSEFGFLGAHGEYVVSYLATNQNLTVSERRRCVKAREGVDDALWAKIAPTSQLLDQVAGWLQQISPGVRLSANFVRGTDEVILQYQYVGKESGLESNDYRPTHVGFGLTYCLPIVVACLATPPGGTLLIENPEAHLHPHGQAKLGHLLAVCAADGVQLLVETHSDHVLNGVRLAVKHRILSADSVRLCYFTRSIATGDSSIELPSVLPDGQLTNWPNGFFDEWERSLDALLS